MLKNRSPAKAISEVEWSQFRKILEIKAEWFGKQAIAVNPPRSTNAESKWG